MKKTSLNLNKLLEEDPTLRNNDERDIEINKRFLSLLPAKFNLEIFGFQISKGFKPITKKDIKQILLENDLVSGDCATAVDEIIHKPYNLKVNSTMKYRFEEVKDDKGNIFYKPYFTWYAGQF